MRRRLFGLAHTDEVYYECYDLGEIRWEDREEFLEHAVRWCLVKHGQIPDRLYLHVIIPAGAVYEEELTPGGAWGTVFGFNVYHIPTNEYLYSGEAKAFGIYDEETGYLDVTSLVITHLEPLKTGVSGIQFSAVGTRRLYTVWFGISKRARPEVIAELARILEKYGLSDEPLWHILHPAVVDGWRFFLPKYKSELTREELIEVLSEIKRRLPRKVKVSLRIYPEGPTVLWEERVEDALRALKKGELTEEVAWEEIGRKRRFAKR